MLYGVVMETETKADVYQIVTDRVITLLEQGTVPWHKSWSGGDEFPRNLISGKAYRGINVWLLGCAGYASPYWLSYKQAQDKGGQVRKGEKSSLAVFWKQLKVEDKATKEEKTVRLLRYYRVFNVEQCDGIEYQKPEVKTPDFNPISECERIVSEMPNAPTIEHKEARAWYSRKLDKVNLPARETFDGEPEYYSTLFHELAHSTGHESRLGRLQDENSAFGSSVYAKEELIAEMSAAYLCATGGIVNRTIDNSAAYIASWLKRLKDDRKLVVQAAGAAHRASDYILGVKYENK